MLLGISQLPKAFSIHIEGEEELLKKLDPSLYEPEFEDGLGTITRRLERGGRGLGSRVNQVRTEREGKLSRFVTTTLSDNPNPKSPSFNPRTTGRSWRDKQISIFKGMRNRVLKSISRKIQERWAR